MEEYSNLEKWIWDWMACQSGKWETLAKRTGVDKCTLRHFYRGRQNIGKSSLMKLYDAAFQERTIPRHKAWQRRKWKLDKIERDWEWCQQNLAKNNRKEINYRSNHKHKKGGSRDEKEEGVDSHNRSESGRETEDDVV